MPAAVGDVTWHMHGPRRWPARYWALWVVLALTWAASSSGVAADSHWHVHHDEEHDQRHQSRNPPVTAVHNDGRGSAFRGSVGVVHAHATRRRALREEGQGDDVVHVKVDVAVPKSTSAGDMIEFHVNGVHDHMFQVTTMQCVRVPVCALHVAIP